MLANLSTPLTVHTQLNARAFNLLKFALNPEEEEEEDQAFVCHVKQFLQYICEN